MQFKQNMPQNTLSNLSQDHEQEFSYGFLDVHAKKEIRRKLLKAVAIPGYQVPFGSREMPIARGWGTGGLQVSLTLTGGEDVLKVIDQGADDSVNASNLRRFISRMTGCKTTKLTCEASIIQSRHRIPEELLRSDQILVLQVPDPEPLRSIEFNTSTAMEMHGYKDYGLMWLKLYEQLVRYGSFIQGASYPVLVHGRYIMSPSPIPRWDTPKMHQSENLTILCAGREKRIYALPPHTDVKPLEFEDKFFQVEDHADWQCRITQLKNKFMNEIPVESGGSDFEISDTGFITRVQNKGDDPSRHEGECYYSETGEFYIPGFIRQNKAESIQSGIKD